MKRIYVIIWFTFIITHVDIYAQAWEIAAWGIESGVNANFGEDVKDIISPYMDCCIGKEVTLQNPDYLYRKYNWKREEGHKEIDSDDWGKYLNQKYTIQRIGYGAEAGFFQYGVVFELKKEEQLIYAIISYRHIAYDDALNTIFKESLPCPEYYSKMISSMSDSFTDAIVHYTPLVRLSDDNQVFVATGKSLLNDTTQFCITIIAGSNTIKDKDPHCIFVFSDGSKLICEIQNIEITYANGAYKMYYSAQINLTEEQMRRFASSYISDIRFIGIELHNIRMSLGQRFMHLANVLMD